MAWIGIETLFIKINNFSAIALSKTLLGWKLWLLKRKELINNTFNSWKSRMICIKTQKVTNLILVLFYIWNYFTCFSTYIWVSGWQFSFVNMNANFLLDTIEVNQRLDLLEIFMNHDWILCWQNIKHEMQRLSKVFIITFQFLKDKLRVLFINEKPSNLWELWFLQNKVCASKLALVILILKWVFIFAFLLTRLPTCVVSLIADFLIPNKFALLKIFPTN